MANIALITNNILSDSGTAITSVLSGSGTTNYLPKFTGSTAIGNSIISESSGLINVAGRISASGLDYSTIAVQSGSAQLKLERTSTSAGYMYIGADDSGFKVFNSSFTPHFIVASTGNVGIGNTNPNQKLELSVGSGVTGGIRINYSASAINEGMDITYLDSGSTVTSFDSRYNSSGAIMQFRMKTAATPVTAMTIFGSGNVLIGTTTDAGYKLFVNGNTWIENSLYFQNGGGGDAAIYGSTTDGIFRIKNNNIYVPRIQLLDSSSNVMLEVNGSSNYFKGNLGLGTTSPARKLTVVDSNAQIRISDGTSGSFWEFYSSFFNTNQDLFIRNQNVDAVVINAGGNVGIGTTSPAYKLHIYGSSPETTTEANSTSGSAVFSAYNSADGHFIQMRSYGSATGGTLFGSSTNKMNSIWSNNDTLFTLGTIGATPLVFGTSNAERMRIDSNGSVLIGTTTNYGNALTVGGSIRIGTTYAIDWNNYSYGSYLDIFNNQNALRIRNASNVIMLEVNGSTNYFTGNLGVNTASPLFSSYSQLTVNGTQGGIVIQGSATGYSRLFFAKDDTSSVEGLIRYYHSDNSMQFWTAATERMSIASSGNVLIGTTTDNSAKLQVNGFSYFGSDMFTYNNGGIFFSGMSSYGSGIFQNPSNSLILRAGSVDRLCITSGGNVGIGTNNPYGDLEVTSQTRPWGEGIVVNPSSSGYEAIFFRVEGTSGSSYTGTWAIGKNAGSDPGGEVFQVVKNGLTGGALYRADASQQWKANGDSIFGFNVGIGTSTPYTILELKSTDPVQRFSVTGGVANNKTYEIRAIGASGYEGLQFRAVNDANTVYDSLMFLSRNGNVGIGATNPAAKLEVRGSTAQLLISQDATHQMYFGVDNSYAEIQAIRSGVAFDKSLILQRQGGNVLIGITTDNGAKLQVNGDAYFGSFINSTFRYSFVGFGTYNSYHTYIVNTNSSNGTYGLGVNNYNTSSDGYILGLSSAGVERMIVRNDGNVGIGTSSPYGKLSLEADGTVNNYSSVIRVANTGSGKWGGISFVDSQTSTTNANNYYFIGRGASFSDRVLSFHIPTASDYGSGSQPKVGFYSTGADTLFTVEASTGTAYFKGNVLIGTTTDGGYKLSVNGNGNFILGNSGYIRLQSGSGQRHGYIQSAFSNFLFSNNIYYDGSNWRYDQNGYGAQIQTETLSVGVIAFNTFASGTGGNVATIIESMRIVNNGNILMGTTTDSGYKLDVNGTSRFTNSISLTGSNRYIGTNASNLSIYITGGSSYLDGAYFNLTGNTYGASPGAGSAEFVIRTNSDSKFALFGYNGSSWSRYMTLYGPTGNLNIGSGTTDSGYKLRIEGNTYNDGEIISVGNITTNASAYVNANQSGYNLTVYPDITSGPNNLYSGGQVKANIYTSSNLNAVTVVPSTSQVVMAWYPSTTQGVFIDYTIWIYGGSDAMRSGTFMVVNDAAGNVQYTDIATPDLNASTALATLVAANNGGVMEVTLTNGSGNVVFINTVTRYIPTMV